MDERTTPEYEAPALEDLAVDEGPASVQAGVVQQSPVA
jgi:hypothetical protein